MSLKIMAICAMLASCSGQPSVSPKERTAYEICDKEVSGGLIAPATYKVIWRGYNDRGPISYSDYRDRAKKTFDAQEAHFAALDDVDRLFLAMSKKRFSNPTEDKAFYDTSGFAKEPVTGFVLVEYDSKNKLGVPIRDSSFCRVRGLNPEGEFTAVYDSGRVDRAVAEAAKLGG